MSIIFVLYSVVLIQLTDWPPVNDGGCSSPHTHSIVSYKQQHDIANLADTRRRSYGGGPPA